MLSVPNDVLGGSARAEPEGNRVGKLGNLILPATCCRGVAPEAKELHLADIFREKRCQKWMTKLFKPFFKVKYFDKTELEKAWHWILKEVEAGVGIG